MGNIYESTAYNEAPNLGGDILKIYFYGLSIELRQLIENSRNQWNQTNENTEPEEFVDCKSDITQIGKGNLIFLGELSSEEELMVKELMTKNEYCEFCFILGKTMKQKQIDNIQKYKNEFTTSMFGYLELPFQPSQLWDFFDAISKRNIPVGWMDSSDWGNLDSFSIETILKGE